MDAGREAERMMTTAEIDLFTMANLSPKRTGLPFVVWISPRGNAQHDIRVKVSQGPKAKPDEFVTVALRPRVWAVDGTLKSHDERLLQSWVEQNWQVLWGYWTGDIEYTEDAIKRLRPLTGEKE